MQKKQAMQDPKRQQKILVDTNVISHIAAIPSDKHSKKIKSFQRASKKWWNSIQKFQEFELVISETIWDELSHGEGDDAKRCQEAVEGIRILPSTPEIKKFADGLVNSGIFRKKSFKDASIAATGCFYKIDYIVTYNMKDLANPKSQRNLNIAADKLSYGRPKLGTPDEFRTNHSKPISSKLGPYNVADKSSNYGEMPYNMNVMKDKEYKEYQEPTFTEEQWLKIQEIESSPIFQKCQKISEEICAKYDYDINKYFDDLMARPRIPGKKYVEIPTEHDRARWAKERMAEREAEKLADAKKAKEVTGHKEYEEPTFTEEQWLKECEARIAAEKLALIKLKGKLKANKESTKKRVVS